MDDMILLLGNFGFPAAISIYLLVRIEGKMEALSDSISALSEVIRSHLKVSSG